MYIILAYIAKFRALTMPNIFLFMRYFFRVPNY